MSEPVQSVDDLVRQLEQLEGVTSPDLVPALPHLLQTAEILAGHRPGDPALVVAGLVHDLASALDPDEVDHAAVGGELVRPLLGDRVAHLVAGHAEAKRYLVTTEPAYAHVLSPDSTHTLVGQGGTMTPGEVAAFAADPALADLVALRRADDAAKVPGAPTRPVADWRALLEQVAAGT